jgi:hypothetical protein
MQRILILILLSILVPAHALTCGSRPERYVADSVLHRRWVVVVDCSHPERPWTLREVPWQSTSHAMTEHKTESPAMPLVSAGTKVRLWHAGNGASIELTGTALECGAAGQTIHVRTGSRGTVLEGKVRAAGSVELVASSKWQGKPPDGWSAQ